MKKAALLGLKDLDEMSEHQDMCYKFDLSRISPEKYANLKQTLRSLCLNQLTGVGFNIDLLKQTQYQAMKTAKTGSRGEKLAQKRVQLPAALNSSVIIQNKAVGKEICVLIGRALPKTETLSFLKFRSLPVKLSDIDILSDGIYTCDTLRVLRFCDVPLGDEGFSRLARALRKTSVVDLQCRHCGLTDACGEDMHSLLCYHVFVQSEADWKAGLSGLKRSDTVCLTELDLRDNEFTFDFVEAIKDPVLDLPLNVVDLRGNAGVSNSIVMDLVRRLKRQGRKTEVRTGPSKTIKAAKPKTKQVAGSPASARIARSQSQDPRTSRIQQLEEENAMMKDLIQQLKSGQNVVELEPGLQIVGPRAAELVQHIRKLDDMLTSYSNGPPMFLTQHE